MAEEKQKKLSDIEKEDAKTEEEASQSDASSPVEKPKKKFKLPGFGKKNKEKKQKGSPKETKVEAEPIRPKSPQELVNDLDGQIHIFDETDEEYLKSKIDTHISKSTKNEITISVSKKQFIRLFGLAVIIAWLIPLSQLAITAGKDFDFESFKSRFTRDKEASASAEIAEEEATTSSKIRVKTPSTERDMVTSIVEALRGADIYESVDLIEEEVEETELTVITKADSTNELTNISQILGDNYPIASSSTTLSDDSSFAAIVIIPE